MKKFPAAALILNVIAALLFSTAWVQAQEKISDAVGKCEIVFPATPYTIPDLRKTPVPQSDKEGKRWFLTRLDDKAFLLLQYEVLANPVDLKNAKETKQMLDDSVTKYLKGYPNPLGGFVWGYNEDVTLHNSPGREFHFCTKTRKMSR